MNGHQEKLMSANVLNAKQHTGKRKMRRFEAHCSRCNHTFVLRTNHKLCGLLLTMEHWKFELAMHNIDCANKKTVELLGGYYVEKN